MSKGTEVSIGPDIQVLQDNLDKYDIQYTAIDEKILKMKSEGREIPEEMIQEREQKRKKVQELKWKIQDKKDEVVTIEESKKVQEIKSMSDEEVLSKYTPEEVIKLQNTENISSEQKAIVDTYVSAVNAQEEKRIAKEIETDYAENGQHQAISEDSDITYRDLEILAQKIATTLRDPKARF